MARFSPTRGWTRGSLSTSYFGDGDHRPGSTFSNLLFVGTSRLRCNPGGGDGLLHRRCRGLDVDKETVVACLRLASDGKVTTKFVASRRPRWTFYACRSGRRQTIARMWRCRRPALTGSQMGHIWMMGVRVGVDNAAHAKNAPGRKTHVNDATRAGRTAAHGLIRAGSVPDTQTEEKRNLLRTRKQSVREQSSHALRGKRHSRRQHQSGLGAPRFDRQERPCNDRGTDRRRNNPAKLAALADRRERRHMRSSARPFAAA